MIIHTTITRRQSGVRAEKTVIPSCDKYTLVFSISCKEVTPNWRRELKVTEILPDIIHLEKVGYFHSHPQFGNTRGKPELSGLDEEYMDPGNIELVVAINDQKKSALWSETKKGLSGTLGKYHVVISGFYKRKAAENGNDQRVLTN